MMKFQTFSIVVGTAKCNAKCPFCVAKMTKGFKTRKIEELHLRELDIACRVAEKSEVITALLTSKGEPTLFVDEVTVEMVAQNTTDDTYATITVVGRTELTLDDNIFVSGELYVIGPSLPYGDEMSVEPFHDTRSNISTALQNILGIVNKDISEISIPLDGNLPVPGIRYTWPDTMLVTNSHTHINVRSMSYDFINEEVILSGEGTVIELRIFTESGDDILTESGESIFMEE